MRRSNASSPAPACGAGPRFVLSRAPGSTLRTISPSNGENIRPTRRRTAPAPCSALAILIVVVLLRYARTVAASPDARRRCGSRHPSADAVTGVLLGLLVSRPSGPISVRLSTVDAGGGDGCTVLVLRPIVGTRRHGALRVRGAAGDQSRDQPAADAGAQEQVVRWSKWSRSPRSSSGFDAAEIELARCSAAGRLTAGKTFAQIVALGCGRRRWRPRGYLDARTSSVPGSSMASSSHSACSQFA